MSDHAKLSPSAASRWLNCTASPTAEAKYPEQTTDYAAEGTFAHSLAELCTKYALGMLDRPTYDRALKYMARDDFYSQEMQDYCEEYSTYIKEKFFELKETCPDAFVELEVKLDLTEYIPEGFGTADCIIVAEPKLWIIDFKYGKGVKVEAEGNQQMEIYALGAIEKYKTLYDIEDIGMAIVQPRLGGISDYEISRGALKAWGTIHIKPRAQEAFEGPGYFRPSETACKFCKASKDCRARAEHFTKLFDDNPFDPYISAEEAGKLLEKAEGMEAWIKDLREKVEEALYEGISVPGWKLVAGRSNRKWSDENQAIMILKSADLTDEEIYKKKLIGIPDAEKLLGKKQAAELLAEVIIKPEGSPVLASADDKRPEIHPAEQIINSFDE